MSLLSTLLTIISEMLDAIVYLGLEIFGILSKTTRLFTHIKKKLLL